MLMPKPSPYAGEILYGEEVLEWHYCEAYSFPFSHLIDEGNNA